MTSPILSALAEHRCREISTRDRAMDLVAREVLGELPRNERQPPTSWLRWAERKGTTAIPAAPSAVAIFLVENEKYGVDTLVEVLEDIAAAHENAGLSSPCSHPLVSAAMNRITKVSPPRSWNAAGRAIFMKASYPLQRQILSREDERDKSLLRSQNQLAEAKKQLNAQQKVETNETIQSPAA
jgi:hypothetical protein